MFRGTRGYKDLPSSHIVKSDNSQSSPRNILIPSPILWSSFSHRKSGPRHSLRSGMRSSVARVLVSTLALCASGVQAGVIPRDGKSSTCKKTKVAVLGAGVSGITAAQALSNASISDFLIIEHNDYIGGHVRNANFGQSADGKPLSVELGANWVQGLASESGNVNPIWTLAQKHGIKNNPSNFDLFLTYDQDGPNDYTEVLEEFDAMLELAIADAGRIQLDNLQDTSTRAGLSLAGWKPGSDMYKQLAEWYGWDFEQAVPPEQCGLVFGAAVHNATFKQFSDENNLVIDQRGFNTFVKDEASEFLVPNDPRLMLSTTVKTINHGPKGVKIVTSDGECIEADYAICTFSIGVLQSDVVVFEPELPRWKREAIEQFEMGTYTKMFMQFNETWWPEDQELFLYADPTERGYFPLFQNLGAPGFIEGSNVLFGTVTGAQSYVVEHQTDEETLGQIMEVLRHMFPDKDIPEPTDFMYPRWTMEE